MGAAPVESALFSATVELAAAMVSCICELETTFTSASLPESSSK